MRRRLRGLFPATGSAYELFDCAVFLLGLAVIGYVLTDPPAVTERALSAPFRFYDQQVWGIGLAVFALAGIVCSYVHPLLRLGYRLVIIACVFWGGCFVYGMVFYGGSARAWLSVLLYGWIASRLWRESDYIEFDRGHGGSHER